jgi:hypothetical protein
MALDIIDLNSRIQVIQALIDVLKVNLSYWDRGDFEPEGFTAEILTLSLASRKLSEVTNILGGYRS